MYECVALTHIARPFQACARKPGYEFFVNITKDNSRLGLFSAAGDCKLPAGTLKVSSPALNTCVGAVIQYSSIDRCPHVSVSVSVAHEPVFVRVDLVSTCSLSVSDP